MLDFSKVKTSVSTWFGKVTKKVAPKLMCEHDHKFVKQVWKPITKRKFTLVNHHTCHKCGSHELRDIGA